jgi:hypothetical protein
MRELEFWVRKDGNIAETERNPCGCCPNDYNFTDNPTIVDKKEITRYIGYHSRENLLRLMNAKGYELLPEVVE